MYLNFLDLEKRHLFLDLEILMAKADGDFDETEKAVIDYHCEEMHIDNNNYVNELSLDEILKNINEKCSDKEKRIIYLEITAVVLADKTYHDKEKAIMLRIFNEFNLSADTSEKAFNIIKELQVVYNKMNEFIKVG